LITGEPSIYNIDAIEDSEIIIIDKHAQDELTEKLRKFETYSRLQVTGAYVALQRRLTSMNSLTVEERYEEFIKRYPHIAQRVPQHMIASYLGLTPETLSRIRSRMFAKS
ncbi:MAG TPA: Crp/Fnr family transcriptional regulator, partial [Patescibacteria group bacterium]|nr:Crp/Fnr family transcriptional regulator [Patescibacteria group bacterium]